MGVTYDTGALIAADRGERRMWARHRALLARREVPTVPAPVVAQSWRGGGRQAQLARLLAGCDVEALDDGQARAVGSLAARAAASDIVDVCIAGGAIRRHDLVVSSGADGIQAIAAAAGRHLEIGHPDLATPTLRSAPHTARHLSRKQRLAAGVRGGRAPRPATDADRPLAAHTGPVPRPAPGYFDHRHRPE